MRSRLAAVLLAISLVACGGDDDPVGMNDPLSEAESTALANILVFQITSFADDEVPFFALAPAATPAQAAATPAQAPYSITEQVSVTLPCALGGSMDLSGSSTVTGDLDLESDDVLSAIVSLVTVHRGCVAVDEGTGSQFTMTGAPNITFTLELLGDFNAGLSVQGTAIGSVRWETPDDRVGLCGIDLSFASSLNFLTGVVTSTTEGQVCDEDISFSETISFSDSFE